MASSAGHRVVSISNANRLGIQRDASGSRLSGRITVNASSVVGTSRDNKTNNKRSMLFKAGLFDDLRLRTLIWWRRTKISASRRALDRTSPMNAPQINLSS